MNLYTVIMGFSDHRQGVGQYEAESPLQALKTFIENSESLHGFDRQKLLNGISSDPFIHLKHFKGIWVARFVPAVISEIADSNGDKVLGAHVLQSDPNGPEREG